MSIPMNSHCVDCLMGKHLSNARELGDDQQAYAFAKAVMQLLDQLQEKYSVDEKRIYVMGFSMGGYGTWNALMNHPDVFAAGVPMCGAGDPSKAELLKNIPIWGFLFLQSILFYVIIKMLLGVPTMGCDDPFTKRL